MFAKPSSIVRLAKTAAAATSTRPRLQEYLVVIRDLPNADRTTAPKTPISVSRQTFTGEILHAPRPRLSTTAASHRQFPPGLQGNVIALRATSLEEVHEQLRRHPYAQGIWDLASARIWPVETVHTSSFDGEKKLPQEESHPHEGELAMREEGTK